VNEEFENLVLASMGVPYIPFKLFTPSRQFEIISSSPELIFAYTCPEYSKEYQTHLTGAYNIHNIIAALAIGNHFRVPYEDGLAAICEYIPENNRSQITKTASNLVLMDAYNANPNSMSQALINLSQQKEATFFVIGDMFELGDSSAPEHEKILSLATELNLSGIAIGKHFSAFQNTGNYTLFDTKEKALEWLLAHPPQNKTILLKGSRGMKLEELLSAL
jgi:UDP-N-acetylmuramoyl-tripeptide--D-alanyl-D-alanine ligase